MENQRPSPDLNVTPETTVPVTVEELRDVVMHFMIVDSFRVIDAGPNPTVQFTGQLRAEEAEELFDEMLGQFTPLGYTPLLREEDGECVLQLLPQIIEGKMGNRLVNVVLFLLTIVSVSFTGLLMENVNVLESPEGVWRGVRFAIALLGILTAHELSHYFVGRRYGSPVSLPYFIPLPLLSPLGTMGAVIVQRGPMQSRKSIFDIGIAGPVGGLLVAIPLLLVGLMYTHVGHPEQFVDLEEGATMQEGNSLLYAGAKYLVHGEVLPTEEGEDVWLGPPSPGGTIVFAAWAGLLVTSLNLFPVGQLDGGHVAYAMWGRNAWKISQVVVIITFIWGLFLLITGNLAGVTWLLWSGLGQLMGPKHPPPLNDVTPLDFKRRVIGWVLIVIFFLILVPIPLVVSS